MKKKKEIIHNKLARDRIPDLLAAKNIECITKILDVSSYQTALSKKLQEEVLEYIASKENDHQMEELADILEVIHAILALRGDRFADLENVRKKKFEARGGFNQRIFLEKTIFEDINHQNHTADCIFCQIGRNELDAEIIAKFAHCYAIKDKYPVTPGHLLIIPYEHTEHWFTAKEEVRLDIIHALDHMKASLDLEYQPKGYNIGANCGKISGQSVMHLHVHLIPRYEGDTKDPKGGVRGVIPSKQHY